MIRIKLEIPTDYCSVGIFLQKRIKHIGINEFMCIL